MAIAYTDTAWNTAGTVSGSQCYKDITTTVATGDLIVVYGVLESYLNASGTTRTITTQSGSMGSWTLVNPTVVGSSDVDYVAGYALATGSGSITVRVSLRATVGRMGVGLYCIPQAEVGATYGFVGSGFVADADGQVSITLSGSSTVLYAAGDWAATNMGSTPTPAGGTVGRSYFDTTNYAVWAAAWTGQAAGTRNYGPSGLSVHDVSGAVFRMDTGGGGGGSYAAAGTVPVVSTTSADVAKRTSVSGTVAAVTATSATVGLRSVVSGTVAVASSAAATATKRTSVTGSVAVVSSVSGTADIPGGVSGTVAVFSAVAGTVRKRTAVTGTVPVTSTVTGSADIPGAIGGTVAVTSTVAGTVATRRQISGTVPVVSTVTGSADSGAPPEFPAVLTLVGAAPYLTLVAYSPRLLLGGATPVLTLEGTS